MRPRHHALDVIHIDGARMTPAHFVCIEDRDENRIIVLTEPKRELLVQIIDQILDLDAHPVDGLFHTIPALGVGFGGSGDEVTHVRTHADQSPFVTPPPFDKLGTTWVVDGGKTADAGIYPRLF